RTIRAANAAVRSRRSSKRREDFMMANVVQQRVFLIAALVAGGLAAASGAQATVYDVVSGFSLASNPNGPWSYLYTDLVSDTLLPHAVTNLPNTTNGLVAWWTVLPIPYSVTVAKNITGGTIDYENIILPTN